MILKSCENCGVVLDLSKIEKPVVANEDGNLIAERVVWHHREYVPAIDCPVCHFKVMWIED